jgi:serine protease Do
MSKVISNLELLKSVSDATSELVKRLSKSVVTISTRMSRGTGIVIDNKGHIVTCNHVLGGNNRVLVSQKEKTYNAHIVDLDSYNDLALLKIDKEDLEPIEMGNSDFLSTGQFVLAIANPFNHEQPTATMGIVTSPDSTVRGFRGIAIENIIATDAKLNPGFSGGPLVDATGKVIGINSAYVWQRGIAVPINKVKSITGRLLAGGKIRRAYLGLKGITVPIPKDVQKSTDVNQETGVMIFQVEVSGPAKKAGLKMGDVVIRFDGKEVKDFYDLPRILSDDLVGKEITLAVLREEKRVELTITPAEKEVVEN